MSPVCQCTTRWHGNCEDVRYTRQLKKKKESISVVANQGLFFVSGGGGGGSGAAIAMHSALSVFSANGHVLDSIFKGKK